jgi:hypothetical protein
MTTYQERRLNMLMALRDFLAMYIEITKDLPEFAQNCAVIQDIINKIQLLAEEQKSDIKGLTEDKLEIKKNLVFVSADNARKISALAKLTSNIKLENAVKIGRSGLGRVSAVALRDYARIIYNEGQANIEALSNYGVSAESQKSFLDLINRFNDSIAKPRVGITGKKQATNELSVLFETADKTLAKMDAAVDIIRLIQGKFYEGYKTARKQLDNGKSLVSLKAWAIETGKGEPVKGAIFTFRLETQNPETVNGEAEIVRKTAKKGTFNIKEMPAGNYTVNVNKPGYKGKLMVASVAEGEMTELHVELEKS